MQIVGLIIYISRSIARYNNGKKKERKWNLTQYMQLWAPDDGRKNRPKHVERLTDINKLWNVASCWLYSANTIWTVCALSHLFQQPSAEKREHSVVTGWKRLLFVCLVGLAPCGWSEGGTDPKKKINGSNGLAQQPTDSQRATLVSWHQHLASCIFGRD